MKVLKKCAAQGDLLIRRISKIPGDAKKVEAKGGRHILGHSETGHHHFIAAGDKNEVELFNSADPLIGYLKVRESAVVGTKDNCVKLEHDRSYHTHETMGLQAGDYEIRRQRELFPEGWRAVMD